MRISLKKSILLTIFININLLVQGQNDSLVRFSDLTFHSDFEEKAFNNFVFNNIDTLDLFLAINENVGEKDAEWRREIFLSIFHQLEQKKIYKKKIAQKIRLTYSNVHSRFLRKYSDNEYFPEIFQSGMYNCVSASILYALVFDGIDIPYKVKASSNHVYLVANPGSKSVVIETTNPGFEKAVFTGEFKQQYVNNLRTSKLISESEYKNKSVEEIFEENFKEVRDAEFINLFAFQYHNKAMTKLQNNDTESAFELCKKAYFFYPDDQVKALLYTTLIYHLERCKFDKISDMDYLAFLSRFENIDVNIITGIFNNIIYNQLKYINREAYCDSLCNRLLSNISDKSIYDEIDFSYNMQMSYRFKNSDKVEKYITKALSIKNDHYNANILMEVFMNQKLLKISDPNTLLDTIQLLEKRYDLEKVNKILFDHKLRAYLQKVDNLVDDGKITEANKYLMKFEDNCKLPIENQFLSSYIENAYRTLAVYYFYRGNKSRAKDYVNRGMKYAPNSEYLKSVIY